MSSTTNRHPRPIPRSIASPLADRSTAAPAALVNRTRRVVRERAQDLQHRRNALKVLAIPLAVSAAFVLMSSHAVWSLLDQYEISPTGIPDASDQMLVLLLWFLPITAALLAAFWVRRSRSHSQAEPRL